jgi:protocatechuate 3,4-dioxygenase beta subunit
VPDHFEQRLTRREAVAVTAAASAAFAIAACGGSDDEGGSTVASAPSTLPPTPACGEDEPTVEQTEGPFFTPNSPLRASLLERGIAGTTLVLSGRVLATDCAPIAGALLDFGQADDRGSYDNDGFRLRGHQLSDARGRYQLTTIVPGPYAGRTRHVHVKAQPEGGRVLTTQLYFPGEPRNETDGIFDPALLIDLRDVAGGKRGRFDFVLVTS